VEQLSKRIKQFDMLFPSISRENSLSKYVD
jgi:hypothetical protein